MSTQTIFLHINGGRTLWVPGHTASPAESSKSVHILNFVTPMELSRSFYLFDYPIQVVEDARMVSMMPNGKTPQDILVAVNEFRRVCAEDQNFLLQQCYNPNRPAAAVSAPPQPQPQPQRPPVSQLQHQPQQPSMNTFLTPPSSTNNSNSNTITTPASVPASGGGNQTSDLMALLQQRQQQQQQQTPMMPANLYNSSPISNLMGMSAGATGSYAHQQQQLPQNTMYGGMGQGQYMMPNAGGNPNNRNRGGRFGQGQQQGAGFNPMAMSMMRPGYGMAGPPYGGGMYNMHMQMGMGVQQGRVGADRGGPFSADARREPEQILVTVDIPKEVLDTYMNPSQLLVCATMPGPRMTVWLRGHEVPTDKTNKKYVFCKGGIILMLKAKGAEVEGSKPVELFSKQICTHYLIHGYCSRTNCLHEHHSEEQLRHLIAARHVELKAMSKKQRHQLIEDIMTKDKEGLLKAEEEREEREREKAQRKANNRNSAATVAATEGDQQQPAPVAAEAVVKSPANGPASRLDLGSDDDSVDGEFEKREAAQAVQAPAKSASAEATTGRTATSKSSRRGLINVANLGVADSSSSDEDDDSSSSSSSSSSASSRSVSPSSAAQRPAAAEAEAPKCEPKPQEEKAAGVSPNENPEQQDIPAATEVGKVKEEAVPESAGQTAVAVGASEGDEEPEEESAEDSQDQGEDEEAEEEEEKPKKGKAKPKPKAKKAAPKKRARSPAAKKTTTKRTKK